MNALTEAAGERPARMGQVELSNAMLRLQLVLIDKTAGNAPSVERARALLKDGARAIMQLWHGLANEERLLRDMEDIHRRLEHA